MAAKTLIYGAYRLLAGFIRSLPSHTVRDFLYKNVSCLAYTLFDHVNFVAQVRSKLPPCCSEADGINPHIYADLSASSNLL